MSAKGMLLRHRRLQISNSFINYIFQMKLHTSIKLFEVPMLSEKQKHGHIRRAFDSIGKPKQYPLKAQPG